jgi:hypothetical protein
MANDKLDNLVKIRQLKAEPAANEEITGLQRSGAARLVDAKNESLSKGGSISTTRGSASSRPA